MIKKISHRKVCGWVKMPRSCSFYIRKEKDDHEVIQELQTLVEKHAVIWILEMLSAFEKKRPDLES